jgi:16S rRNA A1518/A1519 N6-dimethyltransferase RsmA/KsgA/DIM1 with predicted DNA glycosylase/AP lyase activity
MINKMELHPEKDQHLLLNKKIIARMIKESNLSKEDNVLEIGAGTGILTKEIVQLAGKVLAFETEKIFHKQLDKISNENVKLIYDNALNYSWKEYNKIVSNIPYSLSEPIIMKAIQDGIGFMVLTMGENFKEILEKKETKIGIMANLFYNIEIIMKINKKEFVPIPRVDSWIIKFERKTELTEIKNIIQKIVMKKGKIKNAILYSLVESGKTKNQAREMIKNLGVDKIVLEKPVKSITGKFLIFLGEKLGEII